MAARKNRGKGLLWVRYWIIWREKCISAIMFQISSHRAFSCHKNRFLFLNWSVFFFLSSQSKMRRFTDLNVSVEYYFSISLQSSLIALFNLILLCLSLLFDFHSCSVLDEFIVLVVRNYNCVRCVLSAICACWYFLEKRSTIYS